MLKLKVKRWIFLCCTKGSQSQNLDRKQFKWILFFSCRFCAPFSPDIFRIHDHWKKRKGSLGDTPALKWVNLPVKQRNHVQMNTEDSCFPGFVVWGTSNGWISQLAPCPDFHKDQMQQTEEGHGRFLDHASMVQWELAAISYSTEFYEWVNMEQVRDEAGG